MRGHQARRANQCKGSLAASTTLLINDPALLLSHYSDGTRSPADKISNYSYIPAADAAGILTEGKEYVYILTTSGERSANRELANGTEIYSRAYNSGSYAECITFDWDDVKTFNNSGTRVNIGQGSLVSVGTFRYEPKLITAGDGSTGTGHLIAKNTYNVSDPGKGDAVAFVFDRCYMQKMALKYGFTFIDNDNNS